MSYKLKFSAERIVDRLSGDVSQKDIQIAIQYAKDLVRTLGDAEVNVTVIDSCSLQQCNE